MKSPTTLTERADGAQTANAVPRDPVELAHVGAEPLVELLVAALTDQVQVELAERRREPVRVLDRERPRRPIVDLELVVQRQLGSWHRPFEYAPGVDLRELDDRPVVKARVDPASGRTQGPDHDAGSVGVRAEHGVWVGVLATDECVELLCGDGHEDSSRRLIPATGIATQSGRLSSSYWSS